MGEAAGRRDWLSAQASALDSSQRAGGRGAGGVPTVAAPARVPLGRGGGGGDGGGGGAHTGGRGAVLSTPAAGFIWDAGWRRSGGPPAMELFSVLIHQMSPRTIAPHTFP